MLPLEQNAPTLRAQAPAGQPDALEDQRKRQRQLDAQELLTGAHAHPVRAPVTRPESGTPPTEEERCRQPIAITTTITRTGSPTGVS